MQSNTNKENSTSCKKEVQVRKEKEKKKKKKQSNFVIFSCCRPDDVIGGAVTMPDGGEDSVFNYIKMTEKDGVVFPRIFPTLPNSEKDAINRHKKKDRKSSLTRVFKAVLFETSLAKKFKRRKLMQKLPLTNGKQLGEKIEKIIKPVKENINNFSKSQEFTKKGEGKKAPSRNPSVHSNSSSLKSYARSLSGRTQTFDYTSVDSNQKTSNGLVEEEGKGFYSSNAGLYLILVSLLVLVVWGKACAIVCTSTWLFFVPRWSPNNQNGSNYSWKEEDKKRIIFERLLERNHDHGDL